jgi:hypothetical protein
MKQLYFFDDSERERILNLHESATKNQYLINEQETSTPAANIPGVTTTAAAAPDNQKIAMEKGYGPVSKEKADELAAQGWPAKPAAQQKTQQTDNKKTTTGTQSKYAKHLQNVQNVQNKLKEIDPSFAPTSKDKMDQTIINKLMGLLTSKVTQPAAQTTTTAATTQAPSSTTQAPAAQSTSTSDTSQTVD